MDTRKLKSDIENLPASLPKWQAVKEYIISCISSGQYSQTEALPSENSICADTGLSRSTVRQAFDVLEKEGYVYRVKGKGTFPADYSESTKKQKRQIFSLVVQDMRRSLFPSLANGFDSYLSEVNMQTLICDSGNDVLKQGNIILQLLHRNVDGIALLPVLGDKTPAFQVQILIDSGVPVVLCHRGIEGVDAPLLTWDKVEVGMLAGKYLLERGHKDIAYFGIFKYEVPESHVLGLRDVFNKANIEIPKRRVIYGPMNDGMEGDILRERRLAELLLSDDKPTAIVCSDDTEAERVFWLAYRMGIKVPDDLSIVGFGDSYRNSIFRKMLCSVTIDEFQLGNTAAKLLSDMSHSGDLNQFNSIPNMSLRMHEGTTVSSL